MDFDRFIGLVWRLNVAHKLRLKLREAGNAESPSEKERLNKIAENIHVVVAAVPMSASVVDNKVFVLFRSPTMKDQKSYGTCLTGRSTSAGEENKVADEELADIYADLIHRYTRRYVRSGREYVEAIIRSAVIASNSLQDSSRIVVLTKDPKTNGEPECMVVPSTVRDCLIELGVEEWAKSKAKPYLNEDGSHKPTNNSTSSDKSGSFPDLKNSSTYEWGAKRILCTFFRYYWFTRHDKVHDKFIRVYALRDDLL